MFKNILKIAFRNFYRQKAYSSINILGLTLGLVISVIIAFYVIDDLTYDTFHEDADKIYRIVHTNTDNYQTTTISLTCGPLIPAAREFVPEISEAVRTFTLNEQLVSSEIRQPSELNESNAVMLKGYLTESEFFKVFSFKLLAGDKERVLKDPNGILLTPSTAEKLFPGEDPIGKRLTLQSMGPGTNELQNEPFVIGLVEEPPSNSHIKFDYIIPLRVENRPLWWDSWENFDLVGYCKLNSSADAATVERKLLDLVKANNDPSANVRIPNLQKLTDVHLGSANIRFDEYSNFGRNDRTVVYTLCVIGIMILMLAAINFINLSTARAAKRAKEVGLRKVIGSNRSFLISQFLGESIIYTVLSMVFTVIIIELTLPFFNELFKKQLNINFLTDPMLLLLMLGVSVIIGTLAGIYPSFVLSSYSPAKVLKGNFNQSGSGNFLRKVLVIFQFCITIALISSVLVIHQQINYLKSIDMGYKKDQVLNFVARDSKSDLLMNKLKTIPRVKFAGRSNERFGNDFTRTEVLPEGVSREEGLTFQQLAVDENFFDVLGIELALGRNFSAEFKTDTNSALIINQQAVKTLGWDNPIGKRLRVSSLDGELIEKQIVGVVKDFHFNSLRSEISPLMFHLRVPRTVLCQVKLAGGQINETINNIQTAYSEVYPNSNINFQFMDEEFDKQFKNDRDFAKIITYFSGLAIFIACLGLIGLVAYSIEQRKSEIAVRKVLGSSEKNIVLLLSKQFLKWVAIANVFAWPLSYYGISLWLNDFAYKAPVSLIPYIIAGVTAVLLAFITTIQLSLKAARMNPIEAIRNN